MTLDQAIALQPLWLRLWMNWLLVGGFILPLTLLIWKQSRITSLVLIAAGILAALGTGYIYNRFGYVKLLGLPHILFWTPALIYLYSQLRRVDLPKWPKWLMYVIAATVLISLAFDYTDLARYMLGNRTPIAMPAATTT